ncbi:heat stress transcription factor B-3 [Beta vulgaris subsp. vulgaris]|uniref:heat stress transcription factor B-3 n=1 Tax=Beta vulgaris subsp. vulgaris TaxID=3555 RepID=UPI00054006D0|nr:heat stress transcription factor B-3 [Beta vulgaris subsp. vulgaris]
MEGGVCDKELLEYAIMRKSNPPPFLLKTYMLVDDPATDTVISWNDGGTAFVVWQPAEFSRDLLPTLFKHCNFSSFVRQLNTYGFRKVATNRWEFSNDKFQRGKREFLGQIRRRKAYRQPPPTVAALPTSLEAPPHNHDEDQRSSSTSSSSELNILVDENKRLKMENGVLSSELTTMKNKCNELLGLVAIYANRKEENDDDDDDDNYKKQPKLFGVRLEVQGERERKRKRSEEVYETARLLLSQSCK